MATAERSRVSFWWVALFILLALALGAGTILAVGGSLVQPGAGVVLPLPLH